MMSGLDSSFLPLRACENIYCNSRLGGTRCNCTIRKFALTPNPQAGQQPIPTPPSKEPEVTPTVDAAKSSSSQSSSDCTESKCDPFLLAQLEQFPLEGVNMHEFLPRRHIVARSELRLIDWKMNLIAASPDASSLFLASDHSILNIPLDSNGVPLTIAHDMDASTAIHITTSYSETPRSQPPPGSAEAIEEEEQQTEARRRHLDQFDRFQTNTIQTLHIPNSLPLENNDNQPPASSSHDNSEINCIRLLRFGSYDLLAAVNMNGVLALFDIHALNEAPVLRQCRRSDWDDQSAWSVAAFTPHPTGFNPFAHANTKPTGSHSRSSSTASATAAPPTTTTNAPVPHASGSSSSALNRPVVVVGTNAHYAFLWTMDAADEEEHRGKDSSNHAVDATQTETETESSDASNTAMFSELSANALPGSSTNSPIITTSPPPASMALPPHIEGGHNIPSVNISSDGKFLAFACIDSQVRVVSMPSGKLHNAQVIDDQWGWGVRWIKRGRIRRLPYSLEALRKHEEHTPLPAFLQRLYPRASRPGPPPVGLRILPPRDEEMLNHLTNQFVLQLTGGVPLAAPQQQELRRAIRAQLIGRFEERGVMLDPAEIARQEAEDEEHGDEDGLNSDSEMDNDASEAASNAGDDDDMLSDEEEEEVDAEEIEVGAPSAEGSAAASAPDSDAVDHHEMGWEAGFEPDDQAASSIASSADHSEMEIEPEAVQIENEPQSQMRSASHSHRSNEEQANQRVSFTTQVESVPPTPTGAASREVTTVAADAPSPTATSPSSSSTSPDAPAPATCSDLLIYTSKSHLYLLDHNLNKLDSMQFAVQTTLTHQRFIDRLLFIEMIEELSLLILASSASDRLLLYRIVRYACGSYRLRIVAALPAKESCRVPIKGITVVKTPTQPALDIHSSSSFSPQMSFPQFVERGTKVKPESAAMDASTEIPPSPTSCFSLLARSLESWRVYIQYADETLVGIELSAAQPEPDFLHYSNDFFL